MTFNFYTLKYISLDLTSLKKAIGSLEAALKEEFNSSELPYRVDIVDINAIDSEFKKIIMSQAKIIDYRLLINQRSGSTMNDLDFYFNLKNQPISQNDISDVIKVNLDNQYYYIKRYYKPGKNFIRYLKPKGKAEYKNLLFFARHDFNTIEVTNFLESKSIFDNRVCLVTKSLEDSCNLFEYYTNNKINKDNFVYLLEYIEILKKLHQELRFIHKDYKLRNMLLTKEHKLYLIDCPNGFCVNIGQFNFIISPIYNRFILSNLAIVYKDLRRILNRKQLIILYKNYFNLNNLKLDKNHKIYISKIIRVSLN